MLKKLWLRFKFQFNKKLEKESTRPYIIPTRSGLAYGSLCFFMISLGFLFDNNLLYLQGFFLAGIGIVTMHLTNRNLLGLVVSLKPFQEVFAGEPKELQFNAYNNKLSFNSEIVFKNLSLETEPINIEKESTVTFALIYEFKIRGYNKMKPVEAYSFFPFRLLYTWKFFFPAKEILVYPGLKKWPHQSLNKNDVGEDPSKNTNDGVDFWGHRPWMESESFRRIDFKIKAKTGLLLAQDLRSSGSVVVALDFDQTPSNLTFEERISILSYWVSEAYKQNKDFSLEINNWKLPDGSGLAQKSKALEKLALIEDFTQ